MPQFMWEDVEIMWTLCGLNRDEDITKTLELRRMIFVSGVVGEMRGPNNRVYPQTVLDIDITNLNM